MNKLFIVTVVILFIFVLCGAYFSLSGYNNDDTVTIGYLPSDHDAALFVADAQGMYEREGIQIEMAQFNNGGDLMTAMASGEVDVGYVGITPVLSSIERGVPIKVVSAVQTEGSGLVVSSESNITSAQDLRGSTIATPGEGSIQHMLLQYYLDQNNMTTDDLNVSAMKVATMNDALNTNRIDGMLNYEPYITMAENNGNEVLADSSDIISNHPCCVIAASNNFINNHPNELNAIVNIHENATNYINENPEEAANQLPSDIVADPAIEREAMNNINFISGLNESYIQSVLDFVNIEVELGVLQAPLTENQIFWNGNR